MKMKMTEWFLPDEQSNEQSLKLHRVQLELHTDTRHGLCSEHNHTRDYTDTFKLPSAIKVVAGIEMARGYQAHRNPQGFKIEANRQALVDAGGSHLNLLLFITPASTGKVASKRPAVPMVLSGDRGCQRKTKLYRRGRRSEAAEEPADQRNKADINWLASGGLDINDEDELDEAKEYSEEGNLPMTTEDRLRELAPYGITRLLLGAPPKRRRRHHYIWRQRD